MQVEHLPTNRSPAVTSIWTGDSQSPSVNASNSPANPFKLDFRRRMVDRFWSKVEIVDNGVSCWRWLGSTLPTGYGQFWWDGPFSDEGKPWYAHRTSFYLVNGCIPPVT